MRTALALALAAGPALAANPALAASSGRVVAQEPAVPVALGAPEAVLAEEFSSLRGVRELSTGQLIVADWIEERIYLVDLDAGTSSVRVTVGEGPEEIRLPSGLIPLAGDSTLARDAGNARLSVLGPDGRIVRTLRAEQPGVSGTRGIDAEGGLIFAVPPWSRTAASLQDDSVQVVRWRPGGGDPQPLVIIQGTRRRKDQSPSREARLPMVGFASRDGWVVSSDGSLVIVRGGDYSLERVSPDGSSISGPSYASPPRPVSEADRLDFVRRFVDNSPVSGRGPDGGLGHAPSMSESELVALTERTEFSEVHPFFEASRVLAAPDGAVWVGHLPDLDGITVYDLFNRSGVRVGRVQLEGERYVASVGTRGVYVVHTGPLGLQSLERYPLPSGRK